MFAIKQLYAGKPPRFVEIKSGFPRKSAALAWLIDLATSKRMQVFHETDAENPQCVDVMFLGDQYGEQYAIEPSE